MEHVTHSLPNVDSPTLLRVWHDGRDATLHGDGPNDDRQEACKHDTKLCGVQDIKQKTKSKKVAQQIVFILRGDSV